MGFPAFSYITWHYGQGIRDFFGVWGTYLWFVFNFFSLDLLVKTFASPFMRLAERPKHFQIEDFLEAIITTVIMRVVGMLFRTVTLIIGTTLLAIIAVGGVVAFAMWLALPVLIPASFLAGVFMLI